MKGRKSFGFHKDQAEVQADVEQRLKSATAYHKGNEAKGRKAAIKLAEQEWKLAKTSPQPKPPEPPPPTPPETPIPSKPAPAAEPVDERIDRLVKMASAAAASDATSGKDVSDLLGEYNRLRKEGDAAKLLAFMDATEKRLQEKPKVGAAKPPTAPPKAKVGAAKKAEDKKDLKDVKIGDTVMLVAASGASRTVVVTDVIRDPLGKDVMALEFQGGKDGKEAVRLPAKFFKPMPSAQSETVVINTKPGQKLTSEQVLGVRPLVQAHDFKVGDRVSISRLKGVHEGYSGVIVKVFDNSEVYVKKDGPEEFHIRVNPNRVPGYMKKEGAASKPAAKPLLGTGEERLLKQLNLHEDDVRELKEKLAPDVKVAAQGNSGAFNSIERTAKEFVDAFDGDVDFEEARPIIIQLAKEMIEAYKAGPIMRKVMGLWTEEDGTLWIPQKLMDWVGKIFSVRGNKTPAVKVSQDIVPRFQTPAEETVMANAPHGAGRVPGLGKILDPRARDGTPTAKATNTRAATVVKGQTFAALIGTRQRALFEGLWPVSDDGEITLLDGTHGYLSDVIEDEMASPGSQKISAAQRAWINKEWIPILRDALEMRKAEGMKLIYRDDGSAMSIDEALEQGYFPRHVIGKKNRDVATRGTGARPGGRTAQQRKRLFWTEEQGATGIRPDGSQGEEIMIYDPSIASRISRFLAGEYRSVADHRLATDPNLGGKTAEQRYIDLTVKEANRLGPLGTPSNIDVMREWKERSQQPILGFEEQIEGIPAFKDLFFPRDVVDALRSMYVSEGNKQIEAIAKITSLSKGAVLSADFGLPFIQGLPLFFGVPVGKGMKFGTSQKAWGKAVFNMVKAFASSKEVMANWLQDPENAQAALQLAQSGSSIRRLHDNLTSLETLPGKVSLVQGLKKGHLTHIPFLGRVYAAFGRGAGAFFDTAKIEMWKGLRDGTPKEQWPQLAEAIDNILGQGRMESIGMQPGAMMAERLIFNAPAYYRGILSSVASMFQNGVQGQVARRGILGMAAGVTLSSIGAMLAMGLDWDEIEERLNPARGKFLRVPIPLMDGSKGEVGFGHLVMSLTKLGAQLTTWGDRAVDTGDAGNPLVRFFHSHSALAPGLLMDLATGRDFLGNRQTATESAVRRFLPLAAQQAGLGDGTWGQGLNDAVFNFFGMSSFGQDPRSAHRDRIDGIARERFGVPYSGLEFQQARQLARYLDRQGIRPPPATTRQVITAYQQSDQRRDALMGAIISGNRNRLVEFAHRLPAYEKRIDNTPLTDAWAERYQELLVEEYDKTIGRWDMQRLRAILGGRREDLIARQLRASAERAQRRFLIESRRRAS